MSQPRGHLFGNLKNLPNASINKTTNSQAKGTNMAISQYMETKIISCLPSASIAEISKLMKTKNVGTIIVSKNGKPQGLVTDRDIIIKVIASSKNIESTTAADIMSRPVITAKTSEGVYEVIGKMKKSKVRRIPIVDQSGKMMGIVSFGDLVGLLSDEFSSLSHAVLPHRAPAITKRAA